MKVAKFLSLLKVTYSDWSADRCPTLGAALAYYSVFSLAPLVIIAIGVASLVLKEKVARGQIVEEVQSYVGYPGAQALQEMLAHTSATGGGWLATVLGLGTMILGASSVFVQLQVSLNTIWKVAPKPGRGLWNLIRDRFLAFVVVGLTALLLLVLLVVNALLVGLQQWFAAVLSPEIVSVWQGASALVSFAVVMLLLALIYKLLPDAIVSWRAVWVGALVTALLFTLGKHLIVLYLGHGGLGSGFGAAGSLVAILVWVYYSAQIVLFGAEFTRVYAGCDDSIVPTDNAMFVGESGVPALFTHQERYWK